MTSYRGGRKARPYEIGANNFEPAIGEIRGSLIQIRPLAEAVTFATKRIEPAMLIRAYGIGGFGVNLFVQQHIGNPVDRLANLQRAGHI